MLTRIISGVIGIIIAALIIQTGGWLFTAAVVILACLAWIEYVRAFRHKNIELPLPWGAAIVTFMVLCVYSSGNTNMNTALFPVIIALMMVFFKMIFNHKTFSVKEACITLAGVVYIAVPFYHLLALRLFENSTILVETSSIVGDFSVGCALIWLTFIGTWASDTFAYFVGSAIGKHRLCPDISPKKSIEGFVGGILGTMLCMGALGTYFGFDLVVMLITGALVAIVGTLGDLVESCFKRYVGIKDSGTLIPGHGGVLDRFDSLLFTAPLVYYIVIFGLNI